MGSRRRVPPRTRERFRLPSCSSCWFWRGLGRERLDDKPAGLLVIDSVGRHARGGVVEDPLGIAPACVFLVGVLELDAERAREGRQVVLDDDRTLLLEATELAVAPVIDAGQVRGAGRRSE